MSDLFHESVPDEFIDRVFAVMAFKKSCVFQLLTKRPERMREYMTGLSRSFERLKAACPGGYALEWQGIPLVPWPLPNVWFGYSASTQHDLLRIDYLQGTPATVQFLSLEPILEPIEIPVTWLYYKGTRQWVIVGGESGPGARPCNIDWIRSIVKQCREAEVACFVKQLGARPYEGHSEMDYCCERCDEHPGKHPLGRLDSDGITRPLRDRSGAEPSEWPSDLRVREFPEETPR